MAMNLALLTLAVVAITFTQVSAGRPKRFLFDTGRKAECYLQPDIHSTQNVTGVVSFSQPGENDHITVTVKVKGLDPVTVTNTTSDIGLLHGFHVHHWGDITGGCKSTGGHYNPYSSEHGAPDASNRHVGDFGNLKQTPEGTIMTTFTDSRASLFGNNPIVGRAIVLHAGRDDLGLGGNAGSLANGNAGSRLACCVIGWAQN